MALKTRVAAVRAVPAGTCVSYGCTARLERDSRLAVLPVGYGDGYPRLLSNRMEVLLRGRRCPVVGRICMDMCMVDVTDVPDAVPGDVAELYGREGLLEQAAALAGTIPYELLCNVNPRVPRIYTGRGEGPIPAAPHKMVWSSGPPPAAGQGLRSFFPACINLAAPWENHNTALHKDRCRSAVTPYYLPAECEITWTTV